MANEIVFDEPEFDVFYSYWRELQGDEPAPPKSHFDPLKVPSLMEQMSVLQWFPPDKLLLRLMGTKIVDQTHLETTGTNLLDLVRAPQLEMVKRCVQAHHDHLAVVSLKNERRFASGKAVAVKYAFFPFLGDSGARGFSIGVHKADEEANKLVAQHDLLDHVKVLSLDFADVGNGVPDLSYKATG